MNNIIKKFKLKRKTANARKWKHESGGILRFLLEGGKNDSPGSWLKNVGNFFKSDTGKGLVDLGKGLFSGIADYKSASNNIAGAVEQEKVSAEELYLKALDQAETQRKLALLYKNFSPNYYGDTIINNNSSAVKGHEGWEEYSRTISDAYRKKVQALKLTEQQAREAEGNALSGLFGNFVLKGLGVVGNMIGSKKTSTAFSTTSSKDFWTNPNLGQATGSMPSLNFGVNSIYGTY